MLGHNRSLPNPFPDFVPGEGQTAADDKQIESLIRLYVQTILEENDSEVDERGDLYVGDAGISFMFWKLHTSEQTHSMFPKALDYALALMGNAKQKCRPHLKRSAERFSFICGNAGIYAISAAISAALGNTIALTKDLDIFKTGIPSSMEKMHTKTGCDDFMQGRAGYLAGCYWLNEVLGRKEIPDETVIAICQMIVKSGREYSKIRKSQSPLMYQHYGTQYLGASHGICGILHMLLDSPWFRTTPISATEDVIRDIKTSIDLFVKLQDSLGNFPVSMEDLCTGRDPDRRLLHWCHGAPGAVYLLAKAYLIFKDETYLTAIRQAADLVWVRGVLRKGPGICHGVASGGYVFLLLFRLTNEMLYHYRALKFMEVLTDADYQEQARMPDRPHSLFEGVAGTVCFLVDLLNPEQASFPFMDVFH
ncbi:lanC-like protein 3 homolog [Drosophila guanche]|uniref:LanC-like protein 3 homolog n=1 Tax=Drosophila guanche TaxID=7266 RepID=A0A3B0K527_DROGU|nr:lanC-like protein 3 homolog [Drosophila guanche]SPP80726.1 blast:LanC-like protein 3 homolog [Drosophila guanche]